MKMSGVAVYKTSPYFDRLLYPVVGIAKEVLSYK